MGEGWDTERRERERELWGRAGIQREGRERIDSFVSKRGKLLNKIKRRELEREAF